MMIASSEQRPPLLEALWPHLDDVEKPELLADAITMGDFPSRVAWFLWCALDELLDLGSLAFDGDQARQRYEQLPDLITVYRGTVQAEADDGLTGICWTLNPDKAQWFATTHGRFRNRNSPPVVLTATIRKWEVAGLLLDRGEDEVLLNPECIVDFDVRPAEAAVGSRRDGEKVNLTPVERRSAPEQCLAKGAA